MSPDGKKPGYAIVGTGMMGREHIRAVLQLNQATIVGLYDSNPKSLALGVAEVERVGGKAPKQYTALTTLTDDSARDAIIMYKPNGTQGATVAGVNTRKKTNFLEKTNATTHDDDTS